MDDEVSEHFLCEQKGWEAEKGTTIRHEDLGKLNSKTHKRKVRHFRTSDIEEEILDD